MTTRINNIKYTLLMRLFGITKIPLLAFLWPRVEELTANRAVIRIPLSRRAKNHVGSMYFGSMACGADLAVGIQLIYHMRQKRIKLHFVFKSFHAEFLKRPESDVLFICEAGNQVENLVNSALSSGDRVQTDIPVYAALASAPNVPVANFKLTLSLKDKGQ